MKKGVLKKTILKLVSNACKVAQLDDRQATAAHAAAVAGHKAWYGANPLDGVGGISMNPYNVQWAQRCLDDARKHLEHLEATYEFAIETFVE